MASVTPKLHILEYEYVDNVLEKRVPYRPGHLEIFGKQSKDGNVVIGGPVDDPPSGARIIFRNLTAKEIDDIVQQDPYVINNIVTKYTIRPYFAGHGDSSLKNDFL